MRVVSNTTPLLGLSFIGRIDLLQRLFGEIIIPAAVYDEIVVQGANRIGSDEVTKGIGSGWIHVENVAPSAMLSMLKVDLDKGEAEAMELAIARQADLLLIDERRARAKAQILKLNVTGTIGVLLLAREKDLEIDLPLMLEKLKVQGFRIGDSLIKRILAEKP